MRCAASTRSRRSIDSGVACRLNERVVLCRVRSGPSPANTAASGCLHTLEAARSGVSVVGEFDPDGRLTGCVRPSPMRLHRALVDDVVAESDRRWPRGAR